MQFDLSEDRRMLADMLRRLLAQDAGLERRDAAAYVAPYHAPGDWQTLAELGVLGAFLPVAQVGFGGTAGDIAVVFEEVGRGLCPEPLLGALLSLPLLARFGQDDLVRQIIAGEAVFKLTHHTIRGLSGDADGAEPVLQSVTHRRRTGRHRHCGEPRPNELLHHPRPPWICY